MSGLKLPDVFPVNAADNEAVPIDCTPHLASDETIIATDLAVTGPAGVTITNVAPNASKFVHAVTGKEVGIGKAIMCNVTSSTTGVLTLNFTAKTSNTPRQFSRDFDIDFK